VNRFHFGVILVLLSFGSAAAQNEPLVIRNQKLLDADITYVDTYRLNVIDQPTQFLQIQFSGAYALKAGQSNPPFQLSISLSSFSMERLYLQHSHSMLVAYADGQTILSGLALYDLWYGQQTMNSNKEVSQPPTSGIRANDLPPGTNLAKTHDVKDIVRELLVVESVPVEGLRRLAQAKNVVIQLGSTRFVLNDLPMDRLRAFVDRITPPGYKPEPVESAAAGNDTPSEASNTPLKETMDWLKARLSKVAQLQGDRIEFDARGLAKCQFKYATGGSSSGSSMLSGSPTNANVRTIPSSSNNPGSVGMPNSRVMDPTPSTSRLSRSTVTTQKRLFSVGFADLDPEAIRILATPFEMMLKFATNDTELKIMEESQVDRSPSHWVDKYLYHARTLELRTDQKTAAELREAFVHAIKLCQANPTK
jgi:hypothetical protein